MAKTPKSEPTSKAADITTDLSVDEMHLDPNENRIADLEQRVAEMSERLAFASVAASAPSPVEAQLIEQQNQRILELQRLIGDLGERLTAVQAVNARDEQFKAAVRRVETAATAVQRGLVPPGVATGSEYTQLHGPEPRRDCGCGPCECVNCECCTFEVWMSDVRVDQMQDIGLPPEPADSNLIPTAVMEVWMFASIDPVHNTGVCIPDPSPLSYLPLHKQITDPFGPWVSVNRLVGTATVKKGVPLTVPLTLVGVERENALERLIPGNRDEWGSAAERVTLDCCFSNYSPILISVPLTSWGQAGGAITGRFIVIRRC